MKSFLLTTLFFLAASGLFAASALPGPFDRMPVKASFKVTSTDVKDGAALPVAQMSAMFDAGGKDVSPQLSWSGFPTNTKSFAVTMYDPDAPTGSGFWHWAVADIPASVTSLPSGAGSADGKLLPAGAYQIPNDARMPQFTGAAPPVGHGKHHYFITVYALDVTNIGVPKDATPAYLGFNLYFHTLARAVIVPTAERK